MTDETGGFVVEFCRIRVTPHGTRNSSRSAGSVIDGRTTSHKVHAKPINARLGIGKELSWLKQFGALRQLRLCGQGKVIAVFGLQVIAYNLIRLVYALA